MGKQDTIPKRIWFYWHQGVSDAPYVVKKCIDSWLEHNPEWEVILLDKNNLKEYITLKLPDEKLKTLNLTKQSNLIRLQLLYEYGGVWADATTYCMKPLDEWLHEYTASGFFAFDKPGRDRIMSNWFLVSEPGSPLVFKTQEAYASFFLNNPVSEGKLKKVLFNLFRLIINRNSYRTRLWMSPFFTKILKIYPYYIFHYIFAELTRTDEEVKRIWDDTVKRSPDDTHRVIKYGLLSKPDEQIKKEIEEKQAPIYKLTWKYDHSNYAPDTLLYYLLEH